MSATVSVYAEGTQVVVHRVSSRGAVSFVATLDPINAYKLAQSIQAQADVASSAPGIRSVRCVCIDPDGHGSLRCGGTGDLRDNLGYCYGCRTPEHGTRGPSRNERPTHNGLGAAAWPDES